MKIRIRGQSVRLRLGRSEVARLAAGEPVEETVTFGPDPAAQFGCVLRPDTAADRITHAFDAGRLFVRLPLSRLSNWASSDDVGFSVELDAGPGGTVRLLVEKDFVCIDDASGESQDDAFPNPAKTC